MRKNSWLLALFFLTPVVLFAQIDTNLLCRGNYFTEAEGKAAPQKFAASYHDKKTWEKRANCIR